MDQKERVIYDMKGVAQCPFCGYSGSNAAIYADGNCFRVHCGWCDAQGPLSMITQTDPRPAMEDALQRWNAGRPASGPASVTISDEVRKDRALHLGPEHPMRSFLEPPR